MKTGIGICVQLLAVTLVAACAGDSGDPVGTGDTEGTSDTSDASALCFDGVDFPPADNVQCADSLELYHVEAQADSDDWPACVTDDGEYHLLDDTPSSIARVQAYEDMMLVLRGATTPTVDEFTAARTIYSMDEGLESRLQRREDLRFPEVPTADWDPGVDSDKQCTVASNVEKHAGRCAGPATLAPMINEAFMLGQTGQGQPAVLAARIDAAVLWFMYLSTIKEANTCFTSKAKDCDSSWAYFTGGQNREGGLGLANLMRGIDPSTNDAVWNGFSAFRCLRDLEPADEDPSLEDLSPQGRVLFDRANEQLNAALAHGVTEVVRAGVFDLATTCGPDADARWEFVRTLARALAPTAAAKDPASWDAIESIITEPQPSEDDLVALVTELDGAFGCPQP